MSYDDAKNHAGKTVPVYYTTGQVAELLNMTTDQVRGLIKQGKLPAHKAGKYNLVLHKDVYIYLQTQKK